MLLYAPTSPQISKPPTPAPVGPTLPLPRLASTAEATQPSASYTRRQSPLCQPPPGFQADFSPRCLWLHLTEPTSKSNTAAKCSSPEVTLDQGNGLSFAVTTLQMHKNPGPWTPSPPPVLALPAAALPPPQGLRWLRAPEDATQQCWEGAGGTGCGHTAFLYLSSHLWGV